MIFGFGKKPDKKQVKDVLKVMDFMDDAGIQYEVLGELAVQVGPELDAGAATPAQVHAPNPSPVHTNDLVDPLWKVTDHDCCNQEVRHTTACSCTCHFGATPLD